jgi:hypothetical protein
MAKKWVLTRDRKKSILRASKIHRLMDALGKEVYYRKHRN